MPAIMINPVAYKVSLPNYAQLASQWVGIKDNPILITCSACAIVYNLIEPLEVSDHMLEDHKRHVQERVDREHPEHPTGWIQFK